METEPGPRDRVRAAVLEGEKSARVGRVRPGRAVAAILAIQARSVVLAVSLLVASVPSALAVTTSHIATDAELNALLPVKSFVAEGRIGDLGGAATFELDIGAETSAPAQTAQYAWPNGVDVPFTITLSGNVAKLIVGSKVVSYTVAQTPGGDFYVRTRSNKAGASIKISSLVLNDVSISDQSYAVYGTNGGLDILRVQGSDLTTPFALTGIARLSWNTSSAPNNSNLAFQVKFGVAPSGTPPAVQITSPADGALTMQSLTAVSGSVTGSAPVTVSVNGIAATVTGGTWTATVPLALGANTLTATATNAFGAANGSITVTRGDPPTISLTAPAGGTLFGHTPVTVTGTVAGTAPVSVSVNGVAATGSGDSFTASVPIVEGGNTLVATATNGFGSASAQVAVTLDTTPPIVHIASPADGSKTTASSVTVTGTVTDASPIASFAVNGQAVALAGGAFSTTVSLAEGSNPISATATDAAGNTGSAGIVVTRGDPPTISIATPASGALLGQSSVAVTGNVSGTSPVSVTVNGAAAAVTGSSFTASLTLADGPHTIPAVATNAFGTASASVSFTIDTTPPVVHIAAPANGALTADASVPVTGTVTDASPIASFLLNGQSVPLASGAFSTTLSLSQGANAITAVAVDAAGNTGSDTVSVTRGTPPSIVITTPGAGFTTSQAQTLVSGTVTGTEPLTVQVNGVAAAVSAGGYSATVPLAQGANTITATATNALGTASASVSGTRTSTAPPLSITIQSPPNGVTVSSQVIPVSGSVSDGTAVVTVNGLPATVAGNAYLVPALTLQKGANTLQALAKRGTDTATALATVNYHIPPRVVITSPENGSVLRVAATDVEGVVDDLTARVDVNGVLASVDSGGHFVAPDVPLQPGENELAARAVDPLGGQGQDRVTVTRDDGAAGRLRLVLVDPNRFAFDDVEETEPAFLFASNVDEFRKALGALGMPADQFSTPLDRIAIGFRRYFVFAFAEDPGTVDVFANGEATDQDDALTPIGDLPAHPYFTSGRLPASLIASLVPSDFAARYFVATELAVAPESIFQAGPLDLSATSGAATDEIPLFIDAEGPAVHVASPADGSVITGDTVTVTATASDDHALFESVRYQVRDENFALIAHGTAPVVGGRATIPDVPVGTGSRCILVDAIDASATEGGDMICLTSDPGAPPVALVGLRDGETILGPSATVDLDFAGPATIVSVNGTPDGRSFPAGLAQGALSLPLSPGANTFALLVDTGSGPTTFSFTLFRVDSIDPIRVVDPPDGAFRNTETVTASVVAPVGTPLVEVNGVAGTLAPDGTTWTADVPLVEGANTITAIAHPFGQTANAQVVRDTVPPELVLVAPADGSLLLDAQGAVAGIASEPATVDLVGPSGTASQSTVGQQIAAGNPLLGIPALYQYVFDFENVAFADGSNAFTLRLTDRAGNVTSTPLTVTRSAAALSLVSPADGASVSGLSVDLQLDALDPVTLDAVYVAGRRLPSFDGLAVASGFETLANVPLVPGPNAIRIVYHRDGLASEVLLASLSSTAPASTTATVEGVVTDSKTGLPLGGALVTVTAGGVAQVVVTNPDGSYQAVIPAGSFNVSVTDEGFLASSGSGSAGGGDTFDFAASLLPWTTTPTTPPVSPPPPPPEVSPGAATSRVAGTATDGATQAPLGGVLVTVTGTASSFTLSATSGADGQYAVEGLPAEPFAVTFARDGYSPLTYTVSESGPLDVAIDPALEPLTATATVPQPSGTTASQAAGIVTDAATHTPLGGVLVTVASTGTSFTQSATTGSDGRYTVAGFAPQAFQVTFSRAGYFPLTYTVARTDPVAATISPALSPIPNTVTLVGTVTSGLTGQPEPGVAVQLVGTSMTATTDPSGRFQLENVQIAPQTLELSEPGFIQDFDTFTPTPSPAGYPYQANFTYPNVTGSDRTLAIGTEADGTVADALTGAPLAGAQVQAGTISTVADAEGRFHLSGLAPQTVVQITATAPNHTAQTITALAVVNGNDPIDFRLSATRLGEIDGTVIDAATGHPIRYAEVRVQGSETLVSATKADGSYRLLFVPEGSQTVVVSSPEHFPATFPSVGVTAGSIASLNASLAHRPTTGHLTGHVTDATTGEALANALLSLSDGRQATTGSDGSYSFASVAAGLARITIQAAGHPVLVRTAAVDADIDATTPTVTTADFALDQGTSDPSEARILITAAQGGSVETPDGHMRLEIPPGSLTGDGEITIRVAPNPEAAPGATLTTDPALGLPAVKALSDEVEVLVGAPPGGTKPQLVGPIFVTARYYGEVAASTGAAEPSAFPYLFAGSTWTALRTVPYLHAVDRLDKLVAVALLFGQTETDTDVVAYRTIKHSIQLAQTGSGIPGGLVLDGFRLIVGAVGAAGLICSDNVDVLDLARDTTLNPASPVPPYRPINAYARPLLTAHGWSLLSVLLDTGCVTDPVHDTRYGQILRDLVDSTNAVYHPIWLTYNTRLSLAANGQAFAEKIRDLYPNGTPESPISADPFGPPDADTNPKAFGTFDSFGFSMGGLLARSYQQASYYADPPPPVPGDSALSGRIAHMVAMGTPHHGALQAARVLFPFVQPLLRSWSPGTADLLDYVDDSHVPCLLSGNDFLCELNQDVRSGPRNDASLIAGTRSVVNMGQGVLADLGLSVVPGAVSDGVVPLSSAHGESTLGRRVVPALRNRQTFKEAFDHLHAGTDVTAQGEGDQRISQFVDSDILSVLTDHWVVREQDAVPGRPPGQQIGVVEQCPTLTADGHVTANIVFDFKASNGGLAGITVVTYVQEAQGGWRIVAGADPNTLEFDSGILKSLGGPGLANSKRDGFTRVSIDRDVPAGIDARKMVTLIATTGSLSETRGKAEAQPTDEELAALEQVGRVVQCQ